MSPELDQTLVFGAIGAALGFFVVRFARKRPKPGACGGGGCCTPAKRQIKKR